MEIQTWKESEQRLDWPQPGTICLKLKQCLTSRPPVAYRFLTSISRRMRRKRRPSGQPVQASAGQALHFGGTDRAQPENNEEILHPGPGPDRVRAGQDARGQHRDGRSASRLADQEPARGSQAGVLRPVEEPGILPGETLRFAIAAPGWKTKLGGPRCCSA